MSSLGALNTALSALYAQRKGLEVTGHNIANANTEGYTRQRVDLVANAGPSVPAMFSIWNGVGQGVNVDGTSRLRDAFLDLRSNQEHATQGRLATTQQILGRIELGFGEPSELGLAAQFNDFYAGWDDVANNPTDLAARNALLERANTLVMNLRGTASSLDTLRTDTVDQLRAQIDSVNGIAQRIAELNDNIVNAANAGMSPTDLLDQRDLLVSKLSDTIGITVKPSDNGALNVFVDGTALVRGTSAQLLTVEDAAGVASVHWEKDGYRANVDSGTAGALLSGANVTLKTYRDQLDVIAVRMRDMVNGVHSDNSQDLNGVAGGEFFQATGAGDIRLSDNVAGKPRNIAAAAFGGGTADSSVALKIAALAGHRADPSGPAYLQEDGPDLFYRSLIVSLGVETQAVNRRVDIQYEITRQVDAARDAQSGVNLDEEMTNMLSYQRAYEAAARYMTAVDQMLDRLINSTGLVGR